MKDTTYNGWTNYATWRVNLECIDGLDPREMIWPISAYELADILREYVEDYIIHSTSEGIPRDYAMAFLADVNWHEIAEHLIADYADQAA